MLTLNNNFLVGNAILTCLHLHVFREFDYMCSVGVLEGTTNLWFNFGCYFTSTSFQWQE